MTCGTGSSTASEIATDSNNNTYVCGYYSGTVDFDPSAGEDWLSSKSHSVDSYLTKYDNSGNYISTTTWGGDNFDSAEKIRIDSQDNIYIVGNFNLTVDLDPGAGVAEHTTHNGFSYVNDTYLLKLSPSGIYQWSKSWGAVYGFALAVDSYRNIYVGGMAASGVDFNPDSGVDVISASGAFFSKFNSNGDYQWARVFEAFSVECIGSNSSNLIFVGGTYLTMETDFDPSSGVAIRDGRTDGRCYLSTFE